MARVNVFDPSLDGGTYLTEPEAFSPDPGDSYESAKFGSCACSLMIAQAVWHFAGAKRRAQLTR